MTGSNARGDVILSAWSYSGTDLNASQVASRTVLTSGALYQLNAAKSGRRISDYRQAEAVETFAQAAANDAGANLKAAYWLAVAAQLQPESAGALLPLASRYYQAGATLAYSYDTKNTRSAVTAILGGASAQLSAYATTRQVQGIVAFLNDISQSSVALQRLADVTGDTSLPNVGGDLTQYAWIGVGLFVLGIVALTFSRRNEGE